MFIIIVQQTPDVLAKIDDHTATVSKQLSSVSDVFSFVENILLSCAVVWITIPFIVMLR